jgi:hypothetical protein
MNISSKQFDTKYDILYNEYNCPKEIIIPISDSDAYKMYPKFRWIYNKIELNEKQGIKCAPMPIKPDKDDYPVILKPIMNLNGMGLEICKINNEDEFDSKINSTNFWSIFFEGDHISFDLILLDGNIEFYCSFMAEKDLKNLGSFLYWESFDSSEKKLPENIKKFVDKYFGQKKYTGFLNIESIFDKKTNEWKIIEMHLRSGDILKSNEPELFNAIIDLFCFKRFNLRKDFTIQKVYAIPIWNQNPKTFKQEQNLIKTQLNKYNKNLDFLLRYRIDQLLLYFQV